MDLRPAGLTDAEAGRRAAAGLANVADAPTSRRVADILRSNLCTRFNAMIGVLLVVILVVGPLQDALFGVVLVLNSLVGIVQELRAKRSLDRLSLVTTPRVRVVRSGVERDVLPAEVVLGDVVRLAAGDQVVADGRLLAGDRLEVDEALLTGESEPVDKGEGATVWSGTFVVAGSGCYEVTAVGSAAYAARLGAEARRFRLVRSELRDGIGRILQVVTWCILPVGALLIGSRVLTDEPAADAVRSAVAGLASMVPEGLVLLTSVAFAVSVVRLARHRVVVQDLAAVELLARIDVACLDKTGTLTEPDLEVTGVLELVDLPPDLVDDVVATFARVEPRPNATLRALLAGSPGRGTPREVVRAVPFSSTRKWSAFESPGGGAWILGAADVVSLPGGTLRGRVGALAASGRRVLALARAPGGLDDDELPPRREVVALLVLEERVRPDAAATLRYFREQGVTVKILSGDHPATVGAVARRVGLPSLHVVDGRDLPTGGPELLAAIERADVVGRVTPEQKQLLVRVLQGNGHVVAMTGDGVNDVPALKEADLGVAMASGSGAARAIAPLVLGDDSFAALPFVVAEGRRVIANVEQVANLFVTKTVYASLIALAVGVGRVPFPFLPRHLTIVSTLSIGVPAFFLALAPNDRRTASGFLRRVRGFALPAGSVAAAVTLGVFALARTAHHLEVARTSATIALFVVALRILSVLARPLTPLRAALLTSMAVGFAALFPVPAVRSFLALELPPLATGAEMVAVVALGLALVEALAVTHLVGSVGGVGPGWARARRRAGPAAPGRPATG